MVTQWEVDQAYSAWQSEESRDRGWDGDKVARLRQEYYELLQELEDQTNSDEENS